MVTRKKRNKTIKAERKVHYKYATHGHLLSAAKGQFVNYFKPMFKSYKLDKRTFVVQTINLVLVCFIALYFVNDFLNQFTGQKGSTGILLNTIMVFVVVRLLGIFKDNKVLKWQTLFEMEYQVAKDYCRVFVCLALASYVIKQHTNKPETK